MRKALIFLMGFIKFSEVEDVVEWRILVSFLFGFLGGNNLVDLVDFELIDFGFNLFTSFFNVKVVEVVFVLNVDQLCQLLLAVQYFLFCSIPIYYLCEILQKPSPLWNPTLQLTQVYFVIRCFWTTYLSIHLPLHIRIVLFFSKYRK